MSMAQAKLLSIAAIGDEELVSGLRLAGISKYYVIKDNHDVREEVRKALGELMNEPSVGIIVIPENYAEYVEDMLRHFREGKRITPVIIEVPPKSGSKYKDVVGYYKTFIKASIGFDVEI